MATLLSCLFLVGCEDQTPASRGKAEADSRHLSEQQNELVQLTAKRLSRPDRIYPAESARVPTTTTIASPARAPEVRGFDPGTLWRSETLSDLATAQLKRLLHEADVSMLTEVVSPDFRGTELLPATLEIVFDREALTVRRAAILDQEALSCDREGLRHHLTSFLAASPTSLRHIAVKPIGVDLTSEPGGTYAVPFLLEIASTDTEAARRRQVNAIWRSHWTVPAVDSAEKPRLKSLTVERFEEVTTTSAQPLFIDVTPSLLGATPHFDAQVMRGIEHWTQRLTRLGDMYLTGHHGIALGDVNGDGLEDVYVCDGGSLPNRLYLQDPDGTVRDVSTTSGVDFLEDSRGALLIDLDNDGDQDLVVATVAMILFLENDGTGMYSIRGGHMGAPYPASLAAADYDNDGDLDLYVCIYEGGDVATGARWFAGRTPVPFHDANNGGRNVLLENLGDFQFADVTDGVGLDQNNRRWSFAASWEDYDQDGDADLYVANDFGRNNLYRNDVLPDGTRHFVDVAAEAGVEDMAAGMSVAWGDVNRDGFMDLYVGNMFSSAGNRISFQRHFAQRRDDAALSGTQRMARGNTLFQANPDGTFSDVSKAAGVTMGRWAWSSGFIDITNSGWEDIVVANGYLTQTRDVDL